MKLGLLRGGGYGDVLWITGFLRYWHQQGYEITVYTSRKGTEVLLNDPFVTNLIEVSDTVAFGGDNGAWAPPYWEAEAQKYDLFLNSYGPIERLLPRYEDWGFYLPEHQRRANAENYVEALARHLQVPYNEETRRVRFHPTDEERAWAKEQRGSGKFVLVQDKGGAANKIWPYLLRVPGLEIEYIPDEHRSGVTIRKLMALAQVADAVVGVESVLVNVAAYEPNLKVVLLSHSSHNNLTRDWVNVVPLSANVPCYPCHRTHETLDYCPNEDGIPLCQRAIKPAFVADLLRERLL